MTMALGPTAQFLETAKASRRVLVAFPHAAGLDEAAAALAVAHALRAMGKAVDVVADGFVPRPEHALLPGAETVRPRLEGLQHFTITVPIGQVKLDELAYAVAGDELKITLVPKADNWHPREIAAAPGAYRYDLAVTVGCPDLDALGSVYRDATDFWRAVPVVNLDHAAGNERYGAVNFVDLSATSVSEVAYDFAKEAGRGTVDRAVATGLLAGIIGKTRNFKTEAVSPRTLRTAAELVGLGAERGRIVGELYRTRGVTTLRLWGRALSRLKADEAHRLVWALLSRQDFIAAGAREEEIHGVLDELVSYSPNIKASFVLYEGQDGAVRGVLEAGHDGDAMALAKPWAPVGSPRHAAFAMPTGMTLVDAEAAMLERLRGARSA